MAHSAFLFLEVLAYLLVSANAAIPGYVQSNGRTRLLGSSFGVPGVNTTFDYVVIGGGTAGLTVAARLAENPNLSVAVIEAGGFYELDNGNISQIPAFDVLYSGPDPSTIQPTVDWGIVTSSQTQLGGRQIHYTQGKCLGGSSGRNYLAYHRGSAGSYQQWADTVDDQTYTFQNLLPFFQKSPKFTPPNIAKRGIGSEVIFDPTAFSSTGGPLQVSYTNFYQQFSPYIKQAFQKLGLNIIPGFSSGNLLGFSEIPITVDPQAGTRSSSETSFLGQAISTSTLQVYQRTLAKKILFDANKTATGVHVDTAGKAYSLFASKEVILAAGAFRTPQLLLVSGIGPLETLKQWGIPAQADVPGVGQDMWDQPLFGVSFKVNVTTQSQLADPAVVAQATEEFLANQTGRLNSPASNWVGWEKLPSQYRTQFSDKTSSDLSKYPSDWPELEILPLAAVLGPAPDNANYASITTAILTTTSRGNVTINSTDTSDNPVVNPNWLATSTDQELAVQAIKRVREIALATGIIVGDELAPGPRVQTDAEILAFIKQTLAPFHHAASTCSMGRKDDKNAVVDTQGRVYGVQHLRIVDASIFPLLPPGHPQATVYMLAEKLAAEILKT